MCTCPSHMDRTKHPGSQICLLHNAPLRDDDGAAALSVHLCNLEEATAGVLAHVEVQALPLHHKGARVDLALAPYITSTHMMSDRSIGQVRDMGKHTASKSTGRRLPVHNVSQTHA